MQIQLSGHWFPVNPSRVEQVKHCLRNGLPMHLYADHTLFNGDGETCIVSLDGRMAEYSYPELLAQFQGLAQGFHVQASAPRLLMLQSLSLQQFTIGMPESSAMHTIAAVINGSARFYTCATIADAEALLSVFAQAGIPADFK